MRYFRLINDQLDEYRGFNISSNTLKSMGYLYSTDLSEPINKLKLVDQQIVLKTDQELEEDQIQNERLQYQNYYQANFDLQKRVIQFKQILDQLSLSYDSLSITPESIFNAIQINTNIPDDQKTIFRDNALSIWQYGIVFNLKCLNIENAEVFAYYNFDKLVKYLPQNENI